MSGTTQLLKYFKPVDFIYVSSVFGHGTEFRKKISFPYQATDATILSLRHLGVLAQDAMTAIAASMKIDESGFTFRFSAGEFFYRPQEDWFWNLGTAENEYCAYAFEHYELILPELRVPRKRGARGKAVGSMEHWEKRKALESWVYYYRNIEKLGLSASIRKALDLHPELVPAYLEDPEAALLKSTKLNM